MATIKVCDRCGAVTKSMIDVEVIRIAPAYIAEIETIELCKECAHTLREWMYNPITVCPHRYNQGEENEEA